MVIDDEPEEATTPSDNDTIEEISSSPTTAAATAIAPAPNTQTNTTATKIKRVVKEVEDHFKAHSGTILGDLVRNYESRRKEWQAQDGRLLKAQIFLTTTVSPALRNAHFSENADMRHWYNNLKSIAQQPFEIEKAIGTKMRAHLAASRDPSIDPSTNKTSSDG